MMPKAAIGVNGALFLLLAWLYGGDVLDATRAKAAEVAALPSLPSTPFAAVVLFLGSLGAGLTLAGVLKRRDRRWRGYRVLPIVAVVALFIDLFLLSADKPPFSSPSRAAAALEVFERRVTELSTPSGVSDEVRLLEPVLAELGSPPWLLRGEALKAWALEVRRGCTGPALERGNARAGTLLYCVAADRSQGWVTAVGLRREERFGAPEVVTAEGQPLVAVVQRPSPEAQEPGQGAPEAVEPQAPMPLLFEPDAGTLPSP